jgi:membrane-associated phospholipid phosphatase
VNTLPLPFAAGICCKGESSGTRILITALLVVIISLSNNVLAADLGREDATQAPSNNGKAAYSLLLKDDVAVFEQAPLEAPTTAEGEVPPQEKGTTESLFSLDFPKLLLRDTWYVLSSPARWDVKDWLMVGVGIAGVAAVSLADQSLRTQVQHLQNGSAKDVASQIRLFGGYYSYATLGLFYVGGEVFHDPPARAVFIDGAAAALVASGIITPALKYMVGRSRPDAGQGAYHFTPFSNGNASFPSGETTQAFAVASVVAAHYDSLWVKVSSYGIASLVGMARIYEHGHWTSDALAGSLIGTAVGTAVVHFNEKRRKADKEGTGIFITPLLARGTGGIAITLVR